MGPGMTELEAYAEARRTQRPVMMPPLENGVVVVISPGGMQNNFVSEQFAQEHVERVTKEKR